MVALAPDVMTISGSIFQPLLAILSVSGLCFFFYFMVYSFIRYSIVTLRKFNELYC